jgi:hypothetical protein
MPSGTRLEITGELLKSRDKYQLRADSGNCWRVMLPDWAEKFAGRKVSVTGSHDEDGYFFIQDLRPI